MPAISPTVYTGPYTGNGATAAFPFDFSIVSATDIAVEVDGVVISSALYEVSFGPTSGTVSFNTAPVNGAQILLLSKPDFLQDNVFENQGAYNLSTVNKINRRFATRELLLKDGYDRALKVPLGEVGQEIPLMNIPAVIAVGTDLLGPDHIGTVASDLTGADTIGIVAADLTTDDTIGTVAGNITEVVATGTNIGSVIAVAGDLTNVDIVAGGITNVGLVGGSIANVNAVAGGLANITAVAGALTPIATVATNVANVNLVGGSIANVNSVAGALGNIAVVVGAIAAINTAATNIASVNLTAGSITNVNLVGGSIASVITVAGSIAAVNTVSANMTKVSTVNTYIANVNAVAADLLLGSALSTILRAPAAAQQALASEVAARALLTQVQAAAAAVALPSGFYATYAAMSADIANIAANATVSVVADEAQNGYYTTYKKVAGVLTLLGTIMPPMYFNRSKPPISNNRGRVWVWGPGDSRTQGRPAYRTAYETGLFGENGPLRGATSYNMGSNGTQAASWVAQLAVADQNLAPYDYLPSGNPAPYPTGSANLYQIANADPDDVVLSLLTNDARLNTAERVPATMLANMSKILIFLLRTTRARVWLVTPAPFAFNGNPDPSGFTDFVDADDAAQRSADVNAVYKTLSMLPSSRITWIDTHTRVYGAHRYDSIAASVDPENPTSGELMLGDPLHDITLGCTRNVQAIARELDPSLPQEAKHFTIPPAVQLAPWKLVVRVRGGANGVLNVDNNVQRKRGDIPKGDGDPEPGEGIVAALKIHQFADAMAFSARNSDISDLKGLRQCYVFFPKTGITIGPTDFNSGTDGGLNGYRAFGAAGDFSAATTGYTFPEVSPTASITHGIVYVLERRHIPSPAETQVPLSISLAGPQPLRAFNGVCSTTNALPIIDVTTATNGSLDIGMLVKATGIAAAAVVKEMLLGQCTITTTVGSTAVTIAGLTDGILGVGTRLIAPGVFPTGTTITVIGGGAGGAGACTASQQATSAVTAASASFRAAGGVGRYLLSANCSATATGIALTSQPNGTSKPLRESGTGLQYVVRGVKGVRETISGIAVVDLYYQSSLDGAQGATPYPGKRIGTLTFPASYRSATASANWVQDPANYPLPTTVTLSGGTPTTAAVAGAVTITGGVITAIAVASGGAGYSVAPTVVITNGAGAGAVVTANLTSGVVTSFTISNGGTGYTATTFPNGPQLSPAADIALSAFCTSGSLGAFCRLEVLFGDLP